MILQLQHLLLLAPAVMKSVEAAVALTCGSTSDSSGTGTYAWNFGGQSLYV